MKILIFVCGEGLGHTSRCISVGKEMEDAGHEVHFGAYGYSRELIEQKGFVTHKVPSELTLIGNAGKLDLKRSVLATFKKGQLFAMVGIRLLLKKIGPDVVISDSYYMGLLGARSLGIPGYLIINQSNMEEFFKGEGIPSRVLAATIKKFYTNMFNMAAGVIIPDYPMPHTICRKNLDLNFDILKKTFYSGPLICKKPEQIRPVELPRPHILCTIGGFGYRKPIFLKVIEAARMDPNMHYTLLSGPGTDAAQMEDLPGNVNMLQFIDDQFPYMLSSDVIIAPGGHSTMMEALSFGIPMITFPDRDHSEQQNNAAAIAEDGLGIQLDYSTSRQQILANLKELIGNEEYSNRLDMMKELSLSLDGPAGVRQWIEEKYSSRNPPTNRIRRLRHHFHAFSRERIMKH